jgi:hypothetical protein
MSIAHPHYIPGGHFPGTVLIIKSLTLLNPDSKQKALLPKGAGGLSMGI